MGLWATLGGVVGTIIEPGAGTAAGAALGSALEGDAGGCQGGITAADVDLLRSRISAAELAPIAAHWERDNASRSRPAPFYSASGGAVADWLNGGSDCKHSGDASSQQLALQLLARLRGSTPMAGPGYAGGEASLGGSPPFVPTEIPTSGPAAALSSASRYGPLIILLPVVLLPVAYLLFRSAVRGAR